MIKFRQKDFSILSDTLKGAGMGATVGSIAAGGLKFKAFKDTTLGKLNEDNPLSIVGGGILLGAALGALAGSIKKIDLSISRSKANKRLFSTVLDNLKRLGFKEGSDYTQDPKMATLLKTKVCIVVSRSSDNLELLINTVSDPKLKSISNDIVKNLPSTSVTTEKRNDRFNELLISTISSNNGDAGFVTGIAESFIRNGFPVQLIEVG